LLTKEFCEGDVLKEPYTDSLLLSVWLVCPTSISFGNDNSAKIIGRGTIKLERKDSKVENVLLVEDMKNNLLTVTRMFDQGHKILLDLEKCEIRKEGLGKLVARTIRTPNNIYVLNEIGK
jgi:hypothetical protein